MISEASKSISNASQIMPALLDSHLNRFLAKSCPLGSAVADGFSLRELYRDASSTTFAQSSRAQEIQDSLQHQVKQLSEEKAAGLFTTLSGLWRDMNSSELAQQLTLLQVSF